MITIPTESRIDAGQLRGFEVTSVDPDRSETAATVDVELRGTGGRILGTKTIRVTDVYVDKLALNPAWLRIDDIVRADVDYTIVGAWTAVQVAMDAAGRGSKGKLKAAESALIAAGVLPTGTVG